MKFDTKFLYFVGVNLVFTLSLAVFCFFAQTGVAEADVVGLWLLDEGKGTEIRDASGKKHDGAIKGGPGKWIDGKFGKALEVDGKSEYIEIPHHEDFNFKETFTIEMWARIDDIIPQEWGGIPRKESEYVLAPRKVGKDMVMTMWVQPAGGNWIGPISAKPVGFGEWHHYATTYDGKDVKIFIDGKESVAQKVSGKLNATNNPLRFSNDCCGGRMVKGILDEIRMSNLALSEGDFQKSLKGLANLAVNPLGKLAISWGRMKN